MRNVVEDSVKRGYAELLPSAPDPCNCDLCRESRADVAIALMEGFDATGASPRCGRKPAAMS